jgi:hypothetical protein
LYKTKLELEVDAHERQIRAMEEQKQQAGGKNTEQLDQQIKKVEANLENLKKRQIEVDAISPEDRQAMEIGKEAKPQYLDQPARLFSKDPKLAVAEVEVEVKLGPVEEVKKAKPTAEGGEPEGKATKTTIDKGTAVAEPTEKVVTEAGQQKAPGIDEKAASPTEVTKEVVPPEPPKAEELKAAREEKTKLETQKEEGKKLITEKQQAVEDKKAEIEDLEFDLNENLKKTPRTPAIEQELAEIKRQLIEPRRDLATAQRELDSITRHFEEKIKSIDERLEKIKAIEDQFKGSKPWRQVILDDPNPPTDHDARIGLYGELEATTKLQAAGFEAKGKTPRPERIVLPEDFENTLEKDYKGKQGIDGIFEPPEKTKYDFWAVESKATGEPSPDNPSGGVGKLKDTDNGRQLSKKWLLGNAEKAGLTPADQKAFEAALESGRVRRVYAMTDPKNGTRFFEVETIPGNDTEVKIGREITHEIKKH